MADNNNIELRLNVNTSDAERAINSFTSTTEKAFSSSDKKIQQTGVSLQRVTSNIQKATTELNRMSTTTVPTEKYTQLQQKLTTVQQNANQARRELESMNRLETPQYSAVVQDVDRISRELQNARLELGRFINQGVTSGQAFDRADQEVQRLANELGNAITRQQDLINLGQQYQQDDAYDRQAQKVQNYERVIQSVIHQLQIMETTGSGMQLLSDAEPEKVEMLVNRISASVNQGRLLSHTIEDSSVKTSRLATMWGTVSGAISSAGNRLKQYVSSLRSTTSIHGMSFKKMLTQVLKYVFGIRSIFLLYRKLRTELKNGMKSLGKEFPEIQAQIDSLSNSWWAFKSSLTSAFQPIFSYVIPALVTLIDYLTSAMNALANFFALLTNQGYYYKAVKGNASVAGSVSDTGSAAKEANEELGEYDKLLVIDQDKGGSGGGGGGGAGDSNAYNWEKVPTEASDFVEKLKQAWNDGDWEGLGSLISKKLTDMMESIPWEKIYKKASNFGKGLAQFLNGLITPDLFSAVGGTIAGALNTALEFLKNFGETFDWSNFGNSIASGINRFFKDFKWAEAAQTLSTWANGLLTAITSALQGIDWFQIGQSIVTFIANIDYSKLLGNLATVLLALLSGAFQLVFGMASQLAKEIGKFLEDLGISGAEGFWKGISDNIKESATWVKNIFTKVIDAVKKFFGINSPSKKFAEIGEWCIDGLKKGLRDAVSAIGTWIKENVVDKILSAFDKVKEITATIKGKIDETFDKAKEAWDALKTKTETLWTEAKEKAVGALQGLKDKWDGIVEGTKELIADAKEQVSGTLDSIKTNWETGWETTKELTIGLVTDGWNTVSDWLKDKMGGAVSVAISLTKDFGNKISTVADWVKAQGATAVKSSVSLVKDFGKKVSTVTEWIKAQGATAVSSLVSLKSDFGTSVAKWLTDKGLNVQSLVSLKSNFGKKITTVTGWLQNLGTSVTSLVSLAKTKAWKSLKGFVFGTPKKAANQVSATYTVGIKLIQEGWKNIKQWLGLHTGGVATVSSGVTYTGSTAGMPAEARKYLKKKASGGIMTARTIWDSIPKYASGTNNAHGTLFMAGEAGPEILGHVGGRTEVLNRFQLASTMYTAVVAGIQKVVSALSGLNLNVGIDLGDISNLPPIPVVVTGQLLPLTEAFMFKFEEQHKDLEDIKAKIDEIITRLSTVESSNHEPIVLQLDGKTIVQLVWDATQKRYKQTGKPMFA